MTTLAFLSVSVWSVEVKEIDEEKFPTRGVQVPYAQKLETNTSRELRDDNLRLIRVIETTYGETISPTGVSDQRYIVISNRIPNEDPSPQIIPPASFDRLTNREYRVNVFEFYITHLLETRSSLIFSQTRGSFYYNIDMALEYQEKVENNFQGQNQSFPNSSQYYFDISASMGYLGKRLKFLGSLGYGVRREELQRSFTGQSTLIGRNIIAAASLEYKWRENTIMFRSDNEFAEFGIDRNIFPFHYSSTQSSFRYSYLKAERNFFNLDLRYHYRDVSTFEGDRDDHAYEVSLLRQVEFFRRFIFNFGLGLSGYANTRGNTLVHGEFFIPYLKIRYPSTPRFFSFSFGMKGKTERLQVRRDLLNRSFKEPDLPSIDDRFIDFYLSLDMNWRRAVSLHFGTLSRYHYEANPISTSTNNLFIHRHERSRWSANAEFAYSFNARDIFQWTGKYVFTYLDYQILTIPRHIIENKITFNIRYLKLTIDLNTRLEIERYFFIRNQELKRISDAVYSTLSMELTIGENGTLIFQVKNLFNLDNNILGEIEVLGRTFVFGTKIKF